MPATTQSGGVTVSLRGIRKRFGDVEVLRGVDLDVAAGELVVLLGRSGCGKSTLLRIVSGLASPSEGLVEIGGRDVTRLEPRDRGLAMVFQSYALYPHLNVAENIGFPLMIRGAPRSERAQRVLEVAELLGLGELLERKPAALSGGQRQRVAIGRALVRRPPLYLFDEPLSNLDAALRTRMRAELRDLHARLGATMLYVTHDQTEAMTLADRIVVLEAGEVQQVGTPAQIYRRPRNRFVAGFVGAPAMNILRGEVHGRAFHAAEGGLQIPLDGAVADGPVELGVRPEHVRIEPTNGDEGGDVDSLAATVELSEPIGDRGYLHLRADGLELRATVPGTDAFGFADGARVRAHIDPAQVHLFDPASGARKE